MEFTIKLSTEEVNVLFKALGLLSWNESNPLIIKMQAQAQAQIEEGMKKGNAGSKK